MIFQNIFNILKYFLLQDPSADECGKGLGEDVESDEELVGVEYGCGSLVWIKFPGQNLLERQGQNVL